MGEKRRDCSSMKMAIVIMAKRPELGKCKTRLAAKIGAERALLVYNKLLSHTLETAEKTSIPTYLYLSGEGQLEVSDHFLSKEQINGDLGDRMMQAFKEVLQGFDAAVMIGTDCPEISSDLLLEAFEELNQNDVVFGPSEDGGYYLIGMKSFHQELFQDIEWSTPEVLERSILHAEKKQLKIGQIRQLNDVDTISDLLRSSWGEWFKTTIEQHD